MKKIYLILLFTLLIFNKSFAASGTGEATEYSVKMKKVELCVDAAGTICVLVGERDMVADIAASTAGADVGNYSPTTGLPIGTVFTHIKVTMDRTFTITGTVVLTGDDCATDGGSDSAAAQLLVGTTTLSDVASTTMELATEGGYGASNGTRTGALDSGNFNIDYSNPTYASSMSVSGNLAVIIYELTSSYKIGTKTPTIRISFNTENAIGADNNACAMWIEEPAVTITLQ